MKSRVLDHMSFPVLNYNVGGAKYLQLPSRNDKRDFRERLNDRLDWLIGAYDPHVVTLQEIVEYSEPGEPTENVLDCPSGYVFYSRILIDTIHHPYVSKWTKVKEQGNWPSGSRFGQGNAILWRQDLPHFPVFGLPRKGIEPDGEQHVEDVLLMSGLYLGSRDTEPRGALVAHFVISADLSTGAALEKPLDVFVVNIHLTTLTREREGIPNIDQKASSIRLRQLDVLLNGIVSRYNEWAKTGYRSRGDLRDPAPNEDFDRYPPVWVISGDFNFTPRSPEYSLLERMNFVDLNPMKGQGTKGSGFGTRPTIACDYIFAGPKFTALDPLILEDAIQTNPPPDYRVKVSDHYPVFAEVPLTLPRRQLEVQAPVGYPIPIEWLPQKSAQAVGEA